MYSILKESHNGIGMLLFAFLVIIVIFILVRFLMNQPFNKTAKVFALIGLILMHLQVVLGFVLYFISPLGFSNFSGEAMGDKISRLYIVEHPLGMIIAAVLITIGYSQSKKITLSDKARYKRILIYYTIALALVSYLIPWFVWA